MTGFSNPEKSDLNEWTKSIARVLEDPEGQRHFREFLKESNLEEHLNILELWLKCDNLNQG